MSKPGSGTGHHQHRALPSLQQQIATTRFPPPSARGHPSAVRLSVFNSTTTQQNGRIHQLDAGAGQCARTSITVAHVSVVCVSTYPCVRSITFLATLLTADCSFAPETLSLTPSQSQLREASQGGEARGGRPTNDKPTGDTRTNVSTGELARQESSQHRNATESKSRIIVPTARRG